ncbi:MULTISPECIES: MFS transporter [Kocuria]|uniref:MFS transporter n=1 Tax=Kocuria TaxID=57493 RepID=UPI001F495813|nr:MFS transporter [Kocuria sp. KRD140]
MSSTTEGPTGHPAAREHDPRKACKALIGAYVGTSPEWYDFFLFGATASIVFAPLFFGGEDPALAVLRFLQGMAVGGEWGGATLLAVENAPEHKRGFSSAVVQLGSPTGTILSSMIVAAVVALSEERFLEGAWRIPYLISIVLVAVGVWIRLKIDETDVCKQAEVARSATPHEKQSAPVADTLRAAPGRLIVGIGTYLFGNAGFFVLTTFMISYVTKQLGLPSTVILTAIAWGAVAQIVVMFIAGKVADKTPPVHRGGRRLRDRRARRFPPLLARGHPGHRPDHRGHDLGTRLRLHPVRPRGHRPAPVVPGQGPLVGHRAAEGPARPEHRSRRHLTPRAETSDERGTEYE